MRKKFILAILISTALAVTLYAQSRGNPSQLRVKVDANGLLLVATAAQTNPVTTVQFSNARLAVDASGNLVVAVSGSSGFAPVDATYITQTTNSTLTNEQALASLSTGIMKSTTTTGVVSTIPSSGNAYDSFLGNETFGHSFVRGTITTTSDPFAWSQTWNDGAVTFVGSQLSITKTAAANGSCAYSILYGGNRHFGVCDVGNGGLDVLLRAGNRLVLNDTTGPFIGASSGAGNAAGFSPISGYASYLMTTSPTCASGCGTGPTIYGNASNGSVTLGSSPSGTTIVVNFNQTVPGNNLPPCTASFSATAGATTTYQPFSLSTTQITFTGTYVAGNTITWICHGTN